MKKTFVLLTFTFCVFGVVLAQVPRTISYQGFYTDASGNPVNGSPHKVTFRFFDAQSNAENTALAREVENININKGIISVTIGGGDPSHTTGPDNAALPLDVWTQSYKIQVFVDGTSIGDQVPLTTVPYAFVAGSVDGSNVTGTLAATKISGTLAGSQVGTGISASNITTGTLNPSLFTDGSIPGTKLALDINATNIASGTLSDSRLESTLDVTGVNTSGNITTAGGIHVGGTSDPGIDNLVVDGTITGNGSGISAINASNISSGTISDSRLEATLDVAGLNTSANITTVGGIHVGGTSDPGVDNLVVDGTITGNGSGISAINATNISSGTIADARLETDVDVSGFLTTVGGVHVGGTTDPGVDNLIVDGAFSAAATKFAIDANGNITKLNNLTYSFPGTYAGSSTFLTNNGSGTLTWATTVNVSNGGTGATTAATARSNLSAAGSGANSDITSLTGLSTPLSVAQGGTGSNTLTGVMIGNGTLSVSAVAGSANQYLRRNSGNTAYEFGTFSLVNADINSSAAIADTKLATISTAGKVSGTAITSGAIGGTTSISTSGSLVTSGFAAVTNGVHVGNTTAPAAGNLEVDGFTKPGLDAPAIKMKKLTGTTAAAEGGEVIITHGLTLSKIISVTVIVEATSTFHIHEAYTNNVEYQFNWYLTDTQIRVWNTAGNSGSILSKPIKILVTYEQ